MLPSPHIILIYNILNNMSEGVRDELKRNKYEAKYKTIRADFSNIFVIFAKEKQPTGLSHVHYLYGRKVRAT